MNFSKLRKADFRILKKNYIKIDREYGNHAFHYSEMHYYINYVIEHLNNKQVEIDI